MCSKESLCGIDCNKCFLKEDCRGCMKTDGKPFGGDCMVAACIKQGGNALCALKEQIIREMNDLAIADMEEVTQLYALKGSIINLTYTLPGGQKIKIWDDDRIYLGGQLPKIGTQRCYGFGADENYLMVSEYGENGADPVLVILKKRG